MKKVLYIRFLILLYILAGMSIFCCPVLSDTFDDDFIKNKKLETSIDLKNGTESANNPSSVQDSNNDDVKKDISSSSESNPTSLPPVSGEDIAGNTEVDVPQNDSISQSDEVPKPLYNDKKQALKPDDFYDNFVLDTTSTKLPKGNQNNIFLLGLVSIVVVITSIFLLVNFLRAQKDLNKQRELFHKNFDPLNVRQGFFSADYDIRNAKTDGIEIVKSNQRASYEENSEDDAGIVDVTEQNLEEPAEQIQTDEDPNVEQPIPSSPKEELVPPVQDDLSYQLKEANKVFEESNESEVVADAAVLEEDKKEEIFSDDDLDFIDTINNSSSDKDVSLGEEPSFDEDINFESSTQQDISPVVDDESFYELEPDISENSDSSSIQVKQPETPVSQPFEEEYQMNDIVVDDESIVIPEKVEDFEEEIVDEAPEILSDEEVVFTQEEAVFPATEKTISSEPEENQQINEEDSVPVQDVVVLEQEIQDADSDSNQQEAVLEDKTSVEEAELSQSAKESVPTESIDVSSVIEEEAEDIKSAEPEKTEEQKALEKFEVVDGYKIDTDREILLIKEGSRYSFLARVYKEVFKLFDMNQPDKINRIKEIDEKQGDKQVYMIKGEQHRILFAMNDREANFIMEL